MALPVSVGQVSVPAILFSSLRAQRGNPAHPMGGILAKQSRYGFTTTKNHIFGITKAIF